MPRTETEHLPHPPVAARARPALSRRAVARLAAAAGLAAGRVPAGVRAKKRKNVITVCPTCTYTTVQQAIDAAPGGSTIRVAEGTYSGAVVIDRSLTIRGAGKTKTTLTRTYGDGEYGSVVVVSPGVTATIRNLTITGGKATDPTGPFTDGGGISVDGATLTVKNCAVSGNESRRYGGGIFTNGGTLTVKQVDLTGNTSDYGGGLFVFGDDTFPAAVVSGCTVTANSAGSGGGIYAYKCVLTLQDRGSKHHRPTVVQANSAGRGGGLMLDEKVTATVRGHTRISGNTASGGIGSGGGVFIAWNRLDTALIVADRSSISDNTATGTEGLGGGIRMVNGTVTLEGKSTITGNSAASAGGGIQMRDGTVTLEGKSSITGNSATGDGALGGGVYRDAGTVAGNTANVKDNTPDDIAPPL